MYDLRYSPADDVTLDFKLGTAGTSPQGPGYVFAIVEKNELINIKGTRWDLVSIQDFSTLSFCFR
jgi:hypothetical protein